MAEGGEDFGIDQPGLDHNLDNDGFDDEDEHEVDTTRPFQPGYSSTPYQPGKPHHSGEEVELQMKVHEQSGLPATYFDENDPLLPEFGRRPWSLISELSDRVFGVTRKRSADNRNRGKSVCDEKIPKRRPRADRPYI